MRQELRPRREEANEGSQLDFSDEVKQSAKDYIDSRPDLVKRIDESKDMTEVRNVVAESFGYDPEHVGSLRFESETSVLADALNRWRARRREMGGI